MPLQNRVDPYGEICFSAQRGTLMGNRGRLHNDQREIVRNHLGKRWIICLLEFNGRHQELMRPGRWTELFFLDEATALAAGHRPCAQCQYQRFKEFLKCWKAGNQQQDIDLQGLDDILHGERTGKNAPLSHLRDLPEGVFIEYKNQPFLFHNGRLWAWSFAGYQAAQAIPTDTEVKTLTPYSIIRAIKAGFQPGVHPSIGVRG